MTALHRKQRAEQAAQSGDKCDEAKSAHGENEDQLVRIFGHQLRELGYALHLLDGLGSGRGDGGEREHDEEPQAGHPPEQGARGRRYGTGSLILVNHGGKKAGGQ